MQELAAVLEVSGLPAFLAAFPPHSTRRDKWRRALAALDPELAATVRLFALGEPVAVALLPVAIADALATLAELGLAEVGRQPEPDLDRYRDPHRDPDPDCEPTARLRDVVLGRPLRVWLLATPPALVAEYYFGPDSIALAMHATCRPGSRCLDLCAGPGFQALAALAHCRSAVLVELDPRAARLAEINLALNGAEHRADVRCGDLFAPLSEDERFDHVIANVPFIAVPDGCPFPLAGSGGRDGFEVGRRVLAGLWRHLEPSGSAHLAALLLKGADGLLLGDELGAWAAAHECAVHVTLTGTLPLGADSALVRGTAAAIAASGGGAAAAHEAAVAANYAARGAHQASWGFLRIDRNGSGLRVLDLGGANPLGPWLSLS